MQPVLRRLALLAIIVPGAGLSIAPAAGQTLEERLPACLACHGATGSSETENIPSLGGQPADYLLLQLYVFREKQRIAEPMNDMAAGLSDDELRTAADTMAKLPPPVATEPALEAAALDQARGLVAQYRCGSCHGAEFAGHEQIPRLAAQREDYLVKSLVGYKSNSRAGYDPAMNEVAQELKDSDIPVLARYLARYR